MTRVERAALCNRAMESGEPIAVDLALEMVRVEQALDEAIRDGFECLSYAAEWAVEKHGLGDMLRDARVVLDGEEVAP